LFNPNSKTYFEENDKKLIKVKVEHSEDANTILRTRKTII
jgi:hypothetical protein